MISDASIRNIRFILDLIDNDEIDQYVFNNYIDYGLGIIRTLYGTVSIELIKDIKSNQEHYRKFI